LWGGVGMCRCQALGKRMTGSKQKVELLLDGGLVRRVENSLRTHGSVNSGT
jgi:hypothetical protein